tara:strand:- start:460 stop:642 length:183 start_codon:yes stop_codon:yes gene_type:complete
MKLSKLIKKLVSVANDFDLNTDDIDVNVEDVKHIIYGFDNKAVVEIELKTIEKEKGNELI